MAPFPASFSYMATCRAWKQIWVLLQTGILERILKAGHNIQHEVISNYNNIHEQTA